MEFFNKLNDNKIPERINDKNTVYYNKYNNYHPLKNYLFCIILRIILGILIFNNILSSKVIYILSSLILIIFMSKFIYTKTNWKTYERTILIYGLVPYFTYTKTDHNYAGLLVILDAIMGLQSRHIQNNFLN
jgi:hypothetical protein